MSKGTNPYELSSSGKRKQIEKMFNAISPNYDFLNKVITWGMHRKWYANVLNLVAEKRPERIIDIATGTADMAILLARTNANYILGVDISQGMLRIANKKIQRLNLQGIIQTKIQDAEKLDLPDNFFDVATVAYGIRNFEDLEQGLSEILRVIKPGGSVVILETSVPSNPLLRFGYFLYTHHIMPRIASMWSREKNAYTYLSKSALRFPHGTALEKILQKIGFRSVKSKPQTFGISTIYFAEK